MIPLKFGNAEALYQLWERCWRDSKNHNITFIGKLVTRAKQRGLKEIIKDIKFSRVIDVGCGLGFSLVTLQGMGLNAIGIDVSKTAIEVCKNKGLRVFYKRLEDVTESYDLVFSDGLLEHFLNFEFYAKQLMRISKKYTLIIQTNHESFIVKVLLLLEHLLGKGKNIYEYNYRIQDFVNIFEKNNLELVTRKNVFMNGFILLLFKKEEKEIKE